MSYRLCSGRTQASRSATGSGWLMYSNAITKLLATQLISSGNQTKPSDIAQVPRCGSMRLKTARAVDGCLYRRCHVVPGNSFSSSKARKKEDISERRCLPRYTGWSVLHHEMKYSWVTSIMRIAVISCLIAGAWRVDRAAERLCRSICILSTEDSMISDPYAPQLVLNH